MSYKVLILKEINESGIRLLKENDCFVVFSKAENRKELLEELADADALFVRNEEVDAEMIDHAVRLKVIAKHGVGYDNIDVIYATEKKIQVVYVPFGNNNSVAEHAMMLILNCARRSEYINRQFRTGNYNVRFSVNDMHELSGKVLGLIGCGNIGRLVAKKAKWGFGMEVIGYDPYTDRQKLEAAGAPITLVKNRKEFLSQADFVSLHLPATPESIRSIGMEDFLNMKATAYLINTARGNIVREEELIEALKKGIIYGAGLDVFDKEPLPKDHPFLQIENVFASPHTAGATVEAGESISYDGAAGILEVLYKKPVTYPVNRI